MPAGFYANGEYRALKGLRGAMNEIKRSQLPGLAARGFRAVRRYASQFARFLRFSLAQVRGGRGLIKRGQVYYVPLWLPIALALLLASSLFWGDLANGAYRAALHLMRGADDVELADILRTRRAALGGQYQRLVSAAPGRPAPAGYRHANRILWPSNRRQQRRRARAIPGHALSLCRGRENARPGHQHSAG